MSTTKITGYAAMSVGQMLAPFSYDEPVLGENDVRVAVTHCGICHTDIQAINNFYSVIRYPLVPGHEIVGNVIEAGSGVANLKMGTRVGIGWQGRSCMRCEYCLQGEEQLCRKIVDDATWTPYGGFSSSVVVDHRFAYPLPESMPSEIAAVLMCAGISVFTPLSKYADQSGQKLAILGVGGLGHLAIQYAHAMGYDVTVFSSSPEKRSQAISFGADDFVLSREEEISYGHAFSYDLVLCTAIGNVPWEVLLNIPKKGGRILLASFPNMAMNPTDLVAHNLSITGSFLGNRATMQEMLEFSHIHNIKPMVELMPMMQVNQAMQKVRDNQARYRIVLVNEPEFG